MKRPIAWVGIFAGLLACSAMAAAEENVYKKGLKSTVWVVQPMENTNRVRTGSGSLIDAQKRLVLTNYHVVGDKTDAIVMFPIFDTKGNLVPEREKYFDMLKSNGGIPAKVLFTERSKDLAILQLASIPKGVAALRLAKESPGPGDKIHSIGSPGVSGALFAYTDGSVKAVYQKKMRTGAGPNDPNGFLVDAKIIETSSATNKGDSGGPLMNDKCELIGVTQGMLIGGEDTRTISYFVDITEVKAALKTHKITVTGPPGAAMTSDTTKPEKPPATTGTSGTASPPPNKEKAARSALNGAGLFVGKNDKLKEIYQEVIEKYPGTKAADEAKALLEKLK